MKYLLIALGVIIVACSPSEAAIQTAAAETEAARPTKTILPPTESPVPSATSTNTPTPEWCPWDEYKTWLLAASEIWIDLAKYDLELALEFARLEEIETAQEEPTGTNEFIISVFAEYTLDTAVKKSDELTPPPCALSAHAELMSAIEILVFIQNTYDGDADFVREHWGATPNYANAFYDEVGEVTPTP